GLQLVRCGLRRQAVLRHQSEQHQVRLVRRVSNAWPAAETSPAVSIPLADVAVVFRPLTLPPPAAHHALAMLSRLGPHRNGGGGMCQAWSGGRLKRWSCL